MSKEKKYSKAGEEPETEVKEQETAASEENAEAAEPVQENASANELTELKEKYLRLAAEYDNFRKRTAKEKEQLFTDGMINAVSSFLPVYDNLERAVGESCADEAYKKGVDMIMKQFTDVLTKLSITETPGKGEPFDPNVHNAVMHVEDESLPENSVAEVLQKGFLIGDRVLRHAMVKVAN